MKARVRACCLATLLLLAPLQLVHAAGTDVEVIHWWITGGSRLALSVIRSEAEKRGLEWTDNALLAGGSGGDEQRRTLAARIKSGRYPDMAQMSGSKLAHYAKGGHLTDLTAIATQQKWSAVLPPAIAKTLRHEGKWVGVPVTIHRSNWVWANKKIFDELGLTPPTTFQELLSIAEKISAAGYIPLAHGGQAWQDALLFDNVVLAVGGPDFYRKALIELEPQALGSKNMEQVFEQMVKLRGMVDAHYVGREWNFATDMVIHKRAAMQVMGDWAKAEFLRSGKQPNKDFLCFAYPGTASSFVYVLDVFAAFDVAPKRRNAQQMLASVVMDKDVQIEFARLKGAIPARIDIPVAKFDECGRKSLADFDRASLNATLIPRFESEIRDGVRSAIFQVASDFFQHGGLPKEAVAALVQSVQAAKADGASAQ